ncbi:MAG TPA: 6-phosphogluconolactonase [Pyrinomonadaceae bacterium]|nr:6-phosphogluconolactonase [Pyrinomonadaceae bacterium]
MDLRVLNSKEDLARAAAEHFVSKSSEAVAQKGSFTVALSGGSTPKALYELLVDQFFDQIPWANIHFYWSDERHVPPDHPDSNYRMANQAMLSRVPVSPANVHRVISEKPAADAARDYEDTIKEIGGNPRLDLILLGLGADGHTASIFPGSEVLDETERLVAAPWVQKLNAYRITMTLPLLNNGASVVFLVSGAEKAQIVKEVLEGPEKYPAQAVKPHNGELIWMLDQDAAFIV